VYTGAGVGWSYGVVDSVYWALGRVELWRSG